MVSFRIVSLRMLLLWKRALVAILLIFASLQFLHVIVPRCPEWICRNITFLHPSDLQSEWRTGDYESNLVTGRRVMNRRGDKPKAQQSAFGRYQNPGTTLWDDTAGSSARLPVRFDLNGSDVLVFLHIQKTGGTVFGKNMVQHLVDPASGANICLCKETSKKCKCTRPTTPTREWLFSRFSTGWKCGLHADYTELTNCVDQVLDQKEGSPLKRRYFYMTLLRDPYRRYLSEFLHVQRGATWRTSRHWCGGRFAFRSEIQPCFENDTWGEFQIIYQFAAGSFTIAFRLITEGCTLDEFLACSDNLATNRQTRMLADLSVVGCYNRTYLPKEQHDSLMLASAKKNLKRMAYFGLIEEMEDSQLLFEYTFRFRFAQKLNSSYEARGENYVVDARQRAVMMERISLDIQLYEYAKTMFRHRLDSVKDTAGDTEDTPD